jgi:hypothetical protein
VVCHARDNAVPFIWIWGSKSMMNRLWR